MRSNQIKGVETNDIEITQDSVTFEPKAVFQVTCSPTPAQARQLKDGAKLFSEQATMSEVLDQVAAEVNKGALDRDGMKATATVNKR
ncbi:MAG: hypothetical protein WC551_13840 [Patescibacteria group bacterium]